jgi:SAM-dependent methyltransferase
MFQKIFSNRHIDWAVYLAQFHAIDPGVTERLLSQAVAEHIGTPYAWLASKVTTAIGTDHDPISILDIGCGSAPMQTFLPEHWNYLGIDLSPSELRKAQDAGRKKVILADATNIPLAANSMEVTLSSMAIMLVTPIELAISEAHRVLKPNGVFAITLPSRTPILPRDLLVELKVISSLAALPAMPQQFSEQRIHGLLESSGFVGISHERRRFSFILRTFDDAKLLVDSLYLPGMTDTQKMRAVERLANWALKGREIPISLAMTVARKNSSL